jgi:hypothetical protein
MDVDTPKDSFTPEGLEWYRIKTNLDEEIDSNEIDKTQRLQMAMLCAVCDNFRNRCFYDGKCSDFGECQCIGKHAGALCEFDAGAEAQYIEDGDVVGEGGGM